MPSIMNLDLRFMFVLCLLFIFGACSTTSIKYPKGLLYYKDLKGKDGYSVTYDDRSFIVAGTRTLLLSGSVHYPRSTPLMWDGLLQEMVQDGLNMVEIYLFWNLHEFKRGQQYNLAGSANWTLFVEKAAAAGLFVNLRIGPYVCAEWNYGGLPVWLNYIHGIEFRSSNDLWKEEMSRFVKDMAKLSTPYLAKNGGPIIMAQIENEYNWNDEPYINWCGELAASLQLDIPWIMCNGHSANNTVNTCNGNDCTFYAEEHVKKFPGQPLAWTENEGWFQEWDKEPLQPYDDRTPEDISLAIMKWFARGGSHHNYYMWFGGNHFARWVGSSITNKYADGVNLHADGLPNEPKKTHLQRLHMLLAKYANVLLKSPSQINHPQPLSVFNTSTHTFVNATKQFAFAYKTDSGGVTFLENSEDTAALVKFQDKVFTLPSESSTLIDLTTGVELYCSGKVNSTGLPTKRNYTTIKSNLGWVAWQEDVTKLEGSITSGSPVEQLSITEDESDYLFYQTKFDSKPGNLSLIVQSRKANAMLAFVDGQLQSNTFNNQHSYGDVSFKLSISTSDTKTHQLTFLSVNLGINNYFGPGIFDFKGITGSVTLQSTNITAGQWLHRAKLEGEILNVFTQQGSSSVVWNGDWQAYVNKPIVWFQSNFSRVTVYAGHSLLLNLDGMGRGHIYLNGMDLGRYWLIEVGGIPVQQYYFLPPDLIQETNLLTLIEEVGAPDPSKVALVDSTMVLP